MNNNAGEKSLPNASLIRIPTSCNSTSSEENRKNMLPPLNRLKSFQNGAMRMGPKSGKGSGVKSLNADRKESTPFALTYWKKYNKIFKLYSPHPPGKESYLITDYYKTNLQLFLVLRDLK